MHPCIKPVGSAGIFLTAVESRACPMWCSEATDSGLINDRQRLFLPTPETPSPISKEKLSRIELNIHLLALRVIPVKIANLALTRKTINQLGLVLI